MYGEQMESLISAALADGVLTEKERQVLMNKAQSLGIPLDEFEIVLNARVLERNKTLKSDKYGYVRKCPMCGAVVDAYQMICPECGLIFSGVGPNKFVEKFSTELQKIKNSQLDQRGKSSILSGMFDPSGIYADKRNQRSIVRAESEFVKNYPLPMTVEDSIEMLNYILPKIQLSGSNGATKAWRGLYKAILAKLDQVNQNNCEIQKVVTSYRNQAKLPFWGGFIIWYKGLSAFARTIIFVLVFYIVIFPFLLNLMDYYVFNDARGIDEVKELVEAGNIEGAKIKIRKGCDSAPLYDYYMDNGMWDEAEEYIPKEYYEVTKEAYFSYCQKAVYGMCKEGKFDEARKFIKRKVAFYASCNNPDSYMYKDWNTALVEQRLNAIIDNF